LDPSYQPEQPLGLLNGQPPVTSELFTNTQAIPLEQPAVEQPNVQQPPEIDNDARPITDVLSQDNNLDNQKQQQQETIPISKEQWQWCSNTIKNLKKNKSAGPFLEPVDIVKFNIPHYPDIVKQPMDLRTVQAKVNAREYSSLDQFVDDVRLIFSNCYKFNGTDSPISLMAAEVEKAFDRAVYKIPPAPTVSILNASITAIATTHHIFPISLLLRK
jgi:hypothetical protein